MFDVLLLPVLVACAVSLAATRLCIALAVRLRFLDRPGSEAHKLQARAVPYGGGAGMAVAVAAGLAAAAWLPALGAGANRLADDTPAVDHGSLLPICLGALALFLVGLVDDLRPLPARVKLVAQALVAAVVVPLADLGIDTFQHQPVLYYGVAWAWLVLVTNAYNLLDHADGLCGSVATVSLLAIFSGALLSGDVELARLVLVMVGAIAGFLVWNLPPARVYMGDAGSLPLGFLVGCGTLSVTFWPSGESGSQLAVLTPLLLTALPLFDTATVVIKRLRRRVPIMKGDRSHISHRLSRLGLTPRRSLLTAVSLQLALAAGALQLRTDDLLSGVVVLAQSAAIFVAVVFLETTRDHE